MTQHVLLDNIRHKNLRVMRTHGERFGHNSPTVLTFPTEFIHVQREYPILFRKDPTSGAWFSVALLGFSKNENLFLDGDRWDAEYIPAVIARGPFLIGFSEREEEGEVRREATIHIDMDDPRVSETEGIQVFTEMGGQSHYLKHVGSVLHALHDGVPATTRMFEAFNSLELIAPVKLEIKLTDSEKYDLPGFYTIDQQKLASLDGPSLHRLNAEGFLHSAFLQVASLTNVRKLIDLKVRRQQGQQGQA